MKGLFVNQQVKVISYNSYTVFYRMKCYIQTFH